MYLDTGWHPSWQGLPMTPCKPSMQSLLCTIALQDKIWLPHASFATNLPCTCIYRRRGDRSHVYTTALQLYTRFLDAVGHRWCARWCRAPWRDSAGGQRIARDCGKTSWGITTHSPAGPCTHGPGQARPRSAAAPQAAVIPGSISDAGCMQAPLPQG